MIAVETRAMVEADTEENRRSLAAALRSLADDLEQADTIFAGEITTSVDTLTLRESGAPARTVERSRAVMVSIEYKKNGGEKT